MEKINMVEAKMAYGNFKKTQKILELCKNYTKRYDVLYYAIFTLSSNPVKCFKSLDLINQRNLVDKNNIQNAFAKRSLFKGVVYIYKMFKKMVSENHIDSGKFLKLYFKDGIKLSSKFFVKICVNNEHDIIDYLIINDPGYFTEINHFKYVPDNTVFKTINIDTIQRLINSGFMNII